MTKNQRLSYWRQRKAQLEALFEPTTQEVAEHRRLTAAIEGLLTDGND
jgi:hypothetical protein